jgi:hypothetical protein
MKPEHLQRLMDAGMNYVANESDVSVVVREMNRQFAQLRGMNGDEYEPGAGAAATRTASCAESMTTAKS